MKPDLILDCEVFSNYILIMFMNVATDDIQIWEIKGFSTIHYQELVKLIKVLKDNNIYTFNGLSYDGRIIDGVLRRLPPSKIYKLSKSIIEGHGHVPVLVKGTISNHTDLINHVSRGMSLKQIAVNMFKTNLIESSVGWDEEVPNVEIDNIKEYCKNDIIITKELYNNVKGNIDTINLLAKTYNVETTKTIPMIVNSILKSRCKNDKKDRNVNLPNYPLEFNIDNKINVKLGDGGVHSIHDTNITNIIKSDADNVVIDVDIVSFYPNIIMNNKLISPEFHSFYKEVYDKRIQAKSAGDKANSNLYKLILNSTFGLLNYKGSCIYNPNDYLIVVKTGQDIIIKMCKDCLLYTSPSPRDA